MYILIFRNEWLLIVLNKLFKKILIHCNMLYSMYCNMYNL